MKRFSRVTLSFSFLLMVLAVPSVGLCVFSCDSSKSQQAVKGEQKSCHEPSSQKQMVSQSCCSQGLCLLTDSKVLDQDYIKATVDETNHLALIVSESGFKIFKVIDSTENWASRAPPLRTRALYLLYSRLKIPLSA